MSTNLINDLVRRAQEEPRPSELTIKPTEVGTLVDHLRATMWFSKEGGHVAMSADEMRQMVESGKLKFLGVRVRVRHKGEGETLHSLVYDAKAGHDMSCHFRMYGGLCTCER